MSAGWGRLRWANSKNAEPRKGFVTTGRYGLRRTAIRFCRRAVWSMFPAGALRSPGVRTAPVLTSGSGSPCVSACPSSRRILSRWRISYVRATYAGSRNIAVSPGGRLCSSSSRCPSAPASRHGASLSSRARCKRVHGLRPRPLRLAPQRGLRFKVHFVHPVHFPRETVPHICLLLFAFLTIPLPFWPFTLSMP